MFRYIISLFLPILVFGEDVLSLLDKVEDSPVYKQYTQELEANFFSTKENLYNDSWSVGGEYAYANLEDIDEKGSEYALTIGKEWTFNYFSVDKALKSNKKYINELKHIKLNQLKTYIANLYSRYCINMNALQAKGELALVYEGVQNQIDKGVEFGEFDANKATMAHLTYQNIYLILHPFIH